MSFFSYFETLYSRCQKGDGYIFLLDRASHVHSRFTAEDWQLAAACSKSQPTQYIKYNLQDGSAGPGEVGKTATVSTVVAIGLDVDAGKDGFGSHDDVLIKLNGFEHKPTMIVETAGETGGFHCYWVFEKPHRIESELDREFLSDLFKRFEDHLRGHMGELDSTSNLDRLLRPAGTTNSKYGQPVQVMVSDGPYYDVAQLEASLPKPEVIEELPFAAAAYDGDSIGTKFNQDERSTATMASIMTGLGYEVWQGNGYMEFRRPGSQSGMANGRFGDRSKDGNLQLVCWSPNTPWPVNNSITLFRAYSDLLHGGDMQAAAHALLDIEAAAINTDAFVMPEFSGKHIEASPAPKYATREGGQLEFPAAENFEFREGVVEHVPEDLMRDGGWLEDCMDWITMNSSIPLPELSFSAALHLLGLAAGRGWRDTTAHQTCGNLFQMSIAPTGSGKEAPRRCIKHLLTMANMSLMIGPDKLSSGPGLDAHVSRNPKTGIMIDEAGDLIKAMCNDRAPEYMASIAGSLKILYTASSSPSWKGSLKVNDESETVAHPHLSFTGSTTPGTFFGSMSHDRVTDGLIGRFTVWHASITRDDIQKAFGDGKMSTFIDPPAALVRQFEAVADKTNSDKEAVDADGNEIMVWQEVSRTPEAHARFTKHDLAIRLRNFDHEEDRETVESSLWARANEKTAKFALLFAISRWMKHSDQGVPAITLDDMNRAVALSNFLVRRLVSAVKTGLHTSDTDRNVVELLRLVAGIQTTKGRPARFTELYRSNPLADLKGQRKDRDLIELVTTSQGYAIADPDDKGRMTMRLTQDGLSKVIGK